MTDWADDLSRVNELRETIQDDSAAVSSSAEELLELARNEKWSVQRAAVDALGTGLINRPNAGVAELEKLVQTALDKTVPSPGRWRDGLTAVASVAPETARDAAIAGFDSVPPDQRGDTGTACVARMLERIAVDRPTVVVDWLDVFRNISQAVPAQARAHLLGAHLALVDSHREAVRPVLPDLLAEFDAGDAGTRRVAADLLCGLATHPEDGPDVIEAMIRWLATRPRQPREHRRWLSPRNSIMHPSLTDSPPSGVLGVAKVLARIAEETPAAVVPHCEAIATSLTAWGSTRADQCPRSHLARALAAVTRLRPKAAASIGDEVPGLLDDDSEFVRYWAAQTLVALYPSRPDIVSPAIIGDVLTNSNPDIRGLGMDLAEGCVADGVVDSDGVVTELRTILSDDNALRRREALSIFASVAPHDPQAVRSVLPRLEPYLTDPLTASDAAATVEAVATDDPASIADTIPTLVDCLFADSLTVRTAAAETLVTVGTIRPSLLDDQLSVLMTVVEQAHDGVDAVGDVLATVGDRSLDDDRTVFEVVCDRSTADSTTVRRTATQLLGAFIKADNDAEQTVAALTARLDDTDQRIREIALDALARHVAATGAASLVRSCYRSDTDQWRAISADLLAQATLFDGEWPSAEFQRWLADRLEETAGATRRSFVEATGYICGQIDAENVLVSALLTCLGDDAVAEVSFATVRDVVTHGETTVDGSELAPAVERAVLDTGRDIPPACLDLLPHVATHVDVPQRVADRLLDRLSAGNGDTERLAAAMATLCATGVALAPGDIVSALERYASENPVSTRERTCKNFGCVLRENDGATPLRDTFVPMAGEGPLEQRATAYSVLASVAEEWPACIQPAVDTLQKGACADNDQISGPALSALVAVGRASGDVLYPVTGQVISHRTSSDSLEVRRREYEALALLAADGADLDMTVAQTLRGGLLDSDKALTEYALQATAECNDRRMVPVLQRLDSGVPDWDSLPTHCQTASKGEDNFLLEELHPSYEQAVTAGDVLNKFTEFSD